MVLQVAHTPGQDGVQVVSFWNTTTYLVSFLMFEVPLKGDQTIVPMA
jgi:hypothetical protein